MEIASGTLIEGRYLVEEMIGEGGMAVVYRIRHIHLDTQHAVKVLSMSGKSLRQRLMQEGRVQAALQHPNIVRVTDVVAVENSLGLVMEFIRGPSLEDLIEDIDLSHDQIDAIAVGVFDAVSTAHALDLIHRDLKPGNIMLSPVGDKLIAKVTDFGLVKLLAADEEGMNSKTRTGTAMGTPAYMPPEQIRDAKNVDARADVWALGAILYELVSGERPFEGDDILDLMVAVAGGERRHISELMPDLPPRMVQAIEGALEVDLDTRIQSVVALRDIWLADHPLPNQTVWDERTRTVAMALGANADNTQDFLKRSFGTNLKIPKPGDTAVPTKTAQARNAHITGGTAVPANQTVDLANMPAPSAATAVPMDTMQQVGVTVGPDAGQRTFTLEADEPELPPQHTIPPTERASAIELETLAPVDVITPTDPDETPEPHPQTRKRGAVLVLLGLLGMGLTAVIAGGTYFTGVLATPEIVPQPTPVTQPAPVDIAPQPEPTSAPTPDPQPADAPVPVAPHPMPPPSPQPVSEPTPAPQPVSEPTPAPQPGPAPEPVAEPQPDPTDGVTAIPPEPVASIVPPIVNINSRVDVRLLDESRRAINPARITAGQYTVVAFFEDKVPTEIKTIYLVNGAILDIQCSASQQLCSVKTR